MLPPMGQTTSKSNLFVLLALQNIGLCKSGLYIYVKYANILILHWSIPQQADIIQYKPKS